MIYENGVLKQILVDGGYISFSGSAPYYHFYLKDHLGNNCVALSPSGTAEQVNHYYPFGGLLGESTGNTVQRFRYNGKELDRTHGIDWYDYGARHMTPDAGRFTTIDPMAEKYYSISPYAYCANNPINSYDADGKEVINQFDQKTASGQEATEIFINKINDLKNSIIIFAHGVRGANGLSSSDGIISAPYDFETFLENNSETWNNRFVNGDDITIVLFSCGTGSEGKFAQALSMDESFHNIKIIAPGDDITIYKNGTSSIDDNNTWVEYTNGVVSNKYNGNLLPGTEEFENSSYWEKNGY
jgi:RHS repeat-associated protein